MLDDLQRVSANLQRTQRKLSTGKEINQVEDDPVGAGRAMFLRSEVSDVQQYQKNINEALGVPGRVRVGDVVGAGHHEARQGAGRAGRQRHARPDRA